MTDKLDAMSVEVWQPVSEFDGLYEISSAGRVRSVRRGIILKTKMNNGYTKLDLSKGNIGYPRLVHRLVAQAFIANPDNKPEVNHLDGNRSNNAVSNLEWSTHSENGLHSYRELGRKPTTKLSSAQVTEIRRRVDTGEAQASLAREFGVSPGLVTQIIRRTIWKN